MKRIYLFLLFFLSLNSCQKKNGNNVQSSAREKGSALNEKSLMPVYILSEKTTAIVINIFDTEKPTEFDKLFEKIDLKYSISNDYYHSKPDSLSNFKFFDTTGQYKLMRNLVLEREVKKIVSQKYYIYGTKGFSEMEINDVVFGLDECETNIIGLTIKNFDTVKNGKPIFCSKQILKLNYGKNYNKIEDLIEKFQTSVLNDYSDKIKTKVFANIDSIYFTFDDDFIWGIKPSSTKCLYPSRAIFSLNKNNNVNPIWLNSLDLFGISCD
jgi:hypothetical protein